MWRVPEGREERWFECTRTYESHNRHRINGSLQKRSGYYYIAAILDNHMAGRRPLTQCVQPMLMKDFCYTSPSTF